MKTTRLALLLCTGILTLAGCGQATQSSTSSQTSTTSASPVVSASPSGAAGDDRSADPSASASAASAGASATSSTSPDATGGPAATAPVPSAGASNVGSPLPTPSGTLKKAAQAKLPKSLGDYTGTLSTNGGTQLGMYTGTNPDQMLMVSLVKGKDTTGVARGMSDVATVGHSVCGRQEGVQACVLQLDGGYVHVQGTDTDTRDSLAAVSNQLYDALG